MIASYLFLDQLVGLVRLSSYRLHHHTILVVRNTHFVQYFRHMLVYQIMPHDDHIRFLCIMNVESINKKISEKEYEFW
jgi:hypothetical protein